MYLESVVDNNITYSVDMLRLKTYITYEKFSHLEFFLKTCFSDKIKKMWFSDRIMCFKYNYNIEVEEGKSFYFGFHCNNEKLKFDKPEVAYNFTLEFNPNKLGDNDIILYILKMSGTWFLRRLDLSCDLKINILDLIFDLSGKHVNHTILKGYDDKTVYLGKGDSSVKIYNKKKESNLKIDYDLTRVEMTLSFDDFLINNAKLFYLNEDIFPTIYLNNYLYSFSDYKDRTLLAVLYAVQSGFPINDLSVVYKRKIKALLNAGHKIKFNKKSASEVVRRIFFHYFMQVDDFRWK